MSPSKTTDSPRAMPAPILSEIPSASYEPASTIDGFAIAGRDTEARTGPTTCDNGQSISTCERASNVPDTTGGIANHSTYGNIQAEARTSNLIDSNVDKIHDRNQGHLWNESYRTDYSSSNNQNSHQGAEGHVPIVLTSWSIAEEQFERQSRQEQTGLGVVLNDAASSTSNHTALPWKDRALRSTVPASSGNSANRAHNDPKTLEELQQAIRRIPNSIADSNRKTPDQRREGTGPSSNTPACFSNLIPHHQLSNLPPRLNENVSHSAGLSTYHQMVPEARLVTPEATQPNRSSQREIFPFALLNERCRNQIYKYVFPGPYDTIDQRGDPTTPKTPALIVALRGREDLYHQAVKVYFGLYKWVFNANTCSGIMALGASAKRLIKHLKISRTFFLHNGIPADVQLLNTIDPSESDYMAHTQVPATLFANFPSLSQLTLHFPFCEFHELGFIAGALQVCPRLDRFSFQRPPGIAFHSAFDVHLSGIVGVQPLRWRETWVKQDGGYEVWDVYAWFAGVGGWNFGERGIEQLRNLEEINRGIV